MRTVAYIGVALLTLWPSFALADGLAAFAARFGYSHEDIRKVQRLVESADEQGIPSQILESKAKEGFSKRVPPELIVSVVEDRLGTLKELKRRLPRNYATRQLLDSAMTAIAAGTAYETVEAVANKAHLKDSPEGRVHALFYGMTVLHGAGAIDGEVLRFSLAEIEADLPASKIEVLTNATAKALRSGLVSSAELADIGVDDMRAENLPQLLDLLAGTEMGGPRGFDGESRVVPDLKERSAETERAISVPADTKTGELPDDSGAPSDDDLHEDDDLDHEDDSPDSEDDPSD